MSAFPSQLPPNRSTSKVNELRPQKGGMGRWGACIALFVLAGSGLPSISARELVRYDFEDAIEGGTKPDRVWTIPDEAAPPRTDATAEEIKGQRVTDFQGSRALEFFIVSGNAGISLGQGADDELKGNFASGLVLEATFQITRLLDKASQVLFARYGTDPQNRTFSLMIVRGEESSLSGNDRTVQFLIYPESGGGAEVLSSNIRIKEGETYRIRAVFDPLNGLLSMEISGFEDDLVTKPTQAGALRESQAPFFIGGRFDDGHVNRFFGYIDDVKISTLEDQ